jgi:hypothetical protein
MDSGYAAMVAGGAARAISATVTCPMELIRTYFQSQARSAAPDGPLAACISRRPHRSDGLSQALLLRCGKSFRKAALSDCGRACHRRCYATRPFRPSTGAAMNGPNGVRYSTARIVPPLRCAAPDSALSRLWLIIDAGDVPVRRFCRHAGSRLYDSD